MYFHRNKCFVICTVIAICSILQTILHLVWILYGNYMYTCAYKPTNIFVYLINLTYFYRKDCATSSTDLFVNEDMFCNDIGQILFSSFTNDTICKFGNDLNNRAVVPLFGLTTVKTMNVFKLMAVFDCIWIVAAVALMMGSCVKIKEVWSVLFYVPWLIVTLVVSGIDLTLTWNYVSDTYKTNTVTKWLKFIGIKNYQDFEHYDNDISWVFTSISSIIMTALACRLALFTLLNIISIFFVVKIATVAYNLSYIDEQFRKRRRPIVFNETVPNNEMNLDVTAARIRNWQMFYGADSQNSSTGSSKKNSINSMRENKDLNYNCEHSGVSYGDKCNEKPSVSIILEENRVKYIEIDDNAHRTNANNIVKQSTIDELRGQLPWSYVPSDENKENRKPKHSILKKPSSYTLQYPRHSSSLSISPSDL